VYWLTSVPPVLALLHRDSLQWLCYLSHPSSSSSVLSLVSGRALEVPASPAVSRPHAAPPAALLPDLHIRFTLWRPGPWHVSYPGLCTFSPWYYLSHTLSFPVHYLFKHAVHITVGIREGSCLVPICFLSAVVLSLMKSLFLALL